MYKYKLGVLGGTFDNLHAGHKFFLKTAFDKAQKNIIGITSDEFLKNKKYAKHIQSFEKRKIEIEEYLYDLGLNERCELTKIDDIYGITLEDMGIEAIFVTNDTLENANKINEKRSELNLPNLNIEIIDFFDDDLKNPISSTNIRSGDIDDHGHHYFNLFENRKSLFLNPQYRNDFKKPIGKIINKFDIKYFKEKFVIAVGDVAVAKLIENDLIPNISIFDMITKRETVPSNIIKLLPREYMTLDNKQGTINCKTTLKLGELINKSYKSKRKFSIKIIGEEDLLTIPAILFAPIGAVIFYGLRGVGGIVVDIDLSKKREVSENFLSKFV